MPKRKWPLECPEPAPCVPVPFQRRKLQTPPIAAVRGGRGREGSLASSLPTEDTFFSAELTASGLLVQPTPTDYEPQHFKSAGLEGTYQRGEMPPSTSEKGTDGDKQWLRNILSRNESRRGSSLQFVRTWIHTVLGTTARGSQAPSWVPRPELWPFPGCYMSQLSVTSAPLFGEHTRILRDWEHP